ncbi:MAG: D-aminoacyl-tRNA deacylase [Euryarchaeota archaeon]|nr:D-aminoacyl-tRNA deacylase [Euryarchaeota archaeon]
MNVILVSSAEDPAGTNIKNCLLEHSSWAEQSIFNNNPVYTHTELNNVYLITINDRTIRHENLDKEIQQTLNIKPEQIIFLSRHRSKQGGPTLTVHPIGNYGDAEFGGQARSLVPSSPFMMTQLLRLIKKNLQQTSLTYQVCFEVTHHGPFLETPTMFAEVGSTPEEWQKKEPAQIIAQAVIELLTTTNNEKELPNDTPVLVGVGGGHYAPRFTDIISEKNAAFGHMIPSYHIDAGNIDQEMCKKTLKATPHVQYVYLHKKSLKKSQVTQFTKWFEAEDIAVISSTALSALK